MKFAKGRTQAAVKPQPASISGAASAALQQSPLLRQQAAQLMVIRQGAQQLLQRKQPDGAVSQQISLEEEEPVQAKFALMQQAALEEEEPLQGKFAVSQQAALEEEPLQGKFEPAAVSQRQAEASSNNTGMPDQLKSGIESLSGYAMDDVKVHYNSAKPAAMQAHAYAQGTDIHLAPGQEQHLPHEAWHVVQQKQGRVKATTQLKGEAINDDPGLEHEADVMGAKALQRKGLQMTQLQAMACHSQAVVQRLSHEYYDRAELRYSGRAFAHMSQGELEQYLWDNQSQIVVGQNQTILIGGGLRTGYAV
ncbi:MAG TPA: DUF4157 domain-containing protein, partial [Rheinheimera sp.]|nr:DUF4157 domain-containing protein [Rheinheimera sp.]